MKLKGTHGGRLEIRAQDLRVAYGRFVAIEVPQINLCGRIIAIIGHNGSGKSTLIKSILGLLMPRSGFIEANWVEDGSRTRLIAEDHMAFSPENGAAFEELPVESYLKLWCRIKHNDGNYYKKGGNYYIERLNIGPLFSKLGRELSKGQRRRVQAVVGFLCSPKLFLFDEPFDGLDIEQSNELTSVMLEESSRMSIVVSSHRMEVVERLADTVIVLRTGTVFSSGSVDEVCSHLCGKSILVSGWTQDEPLVLELLPVLQREFYSCLINKIGGQLLVTGNEISIEALQGFFESNRLSGLKLNSVRPSLVDAMRYHLNKLH